MKKLTNILIFICALVGFFSITAGSCMTSDTTYSGAGTIKVGVAGDSISVLGEDELRNSLEQNYLVRVAAVVGERADNTAGGVHYSDYFDLSDSHPDIVIIEVGTNQGHFIGFDANNHPLYSYGPESLDDITNLVNLFRSSGTKCVVGVTVQVDNTGGYVAHPDLAIAENNMLKNGLVDQVADWSPEAPSYAPVGGGVHPSTDGYNRLATLELDAVNRCDLG